MIDYHRFCEIKHLHAHQGLTASQIAKALVLDPRTVSYWLAQEHFRPGAALLERRLNPWFSGLLASPVLSCVFSSRDELQWCLSLGYL